MKKRLPDEIKEILGLIIEVDPGEINENMSRGQDTLWDSLAHLNLILALEEKYSIAFTPEEIEQVLTLKDVLELVQKKLGEL